MQLPTIESLLADLRERGELSIWHRDDGETLLRWLVSELVAEPLLADFLTAFERHIGDTLAELDPAVRATDPAMPATARVRAMSPAATQVLGETLLRFGTALIKTSMVREHFDDDVVADRAADHFADEVRRFLRRRGDSEHTLLSGKGLCDALGPALHENLSIAIAKRAADRINDFGNLWNGYRTEGKECPPTKRPFAGSTTTYKQPSPATIGAAKCTSLSPSR